MFVSILTCIPNYKILLFDRTSNALINHGFRRVDKEDYLLAMERSPIRDTEIKHVLRQALTDDTGLREIYMKGIDHSYCYEGYVTLNQRNFDLI